MSDEGDYRCERAQAHVFDGTCVHCGSANIEAGATEDANDIRHHPPGRRYTKQVWHCEECGRDTQVLGDRELTPEDARGAGRMTGEPTTVWVVSPNDYDAAPVSVHSSFEAVQQKFPDEKWTRWHTIRDGTWYESEKWVAEPFEVQS